MHISAITIQRLVWHSELGRIAYLFRFPCQYPLLDSALTRLIAIKSYTVTLIFSKFAGQIRDKSIDKSNIQEVCSLHTDTDIDIDTDIININDII